MFDTQWAFEIDIAIENDPLFVYIHHGGPCLYYSIVFIAFMQFIVERGSSVVECRTLNQVSPGSNPSLLPFRRLGVFVLSIDAPLVHSDV